MAAHALHRRTVIVRVRQLSIWLIFTNFLFDCLSQVPTWKNDNNLHSFRHRIKVFSLRSLSLSLPLFGLSAKLKYIQLFLLCKYRRKFQSQNEIVSSLPLLQLFHHLFVCSRKIIMFDAPDSCIFCLFVCHTIFRATLDSRVLFCILRNSIFDVIRNQIQYRSIQLLWCLLYVLLVFEIPVIIPLST